MFNVDAETAREAVRARRMFNAIHVVNANTLDRGYLREWAREIGVLDVVMRVLRESGIEDAGSEG